MSLSSLNRSINVELLEKIKNNLQENKNLGKREVNKVLKFLESNPVMDLDMLEIYLQDPENGFISPEEIVKTIEDAVNQKDSENSKSTQSLLKNIPGLN
jgi:hypothetical protein